MRRYVDRQLRSQRSLGQLEPVDDGLIGLALTYADAMDRIVVKPEPNEYNLVHAGKALREVLLDLRGDRRDSAGSAGWDDELEALIATLRDAARSRAADDRAGDPRPPSETAP